jgi:hypothetical protein
MDLSQVRAICDAAMREYGLPARIRTDNGAPFAYLLISEHTVPPNWVFVLASFLCIFGVFLHCISDAQKFFVLQLRKGIVQDGLFARTPATFYRESSIRELLDCRSQTVTTKRSAPARTTGIPHKPY